MNDDLTRAGRVAVAYLIMWAILLTLGGCGYEAMAGNKAPDLGVAPTNPERCQCAADEGKEIWWTFAQRSDGQEVNILSSEPISPRFSSRYVCRNHGKERHGYWWEQAR